MPFAPKICILVKSEQHLAYLVRLETSLTQAPVPAVAQEQWFPEVLQYAPRSYVILFIFY